MRKPSEVNWSEERSDGYVEFEEELRGWLASEYPRGVVFTAKEVAKKTGFAPKTILARLENLEENGLMGRDKEGFWLPALATTFPPPNDPVSVPAYLIPVPHVELADGMTVWAGSLAWVPDNWERGLVLAVDVVKQQVLVTHASYENGAGEATPREPGSMFIRSWVSLPSGGVIKPLLPLSVPAYVVVAWYPREWLRGSPPSKESRPDYVLNAYEGTDKKLR